MTNRVIDGPAWAESQARMIAERDANPQLAAMAKASKPTEAEQAEIDAAEIKVREAKAALEAAGTALARTRSAMESTPGYDTSRPFTFFLKAPRTYKAAAAALPGVQSDWEEARTHLQNATRRLNATRRAIDIARAERRLAAKLKHAPKPVPRQSQVDAWYRAKIVRRSAR